jgi:hypothetical protein
MPQTVENGTEGFKFQSSRMTRTTGSVTRDLPDLLHSDLTLPSITIPDAKGDTHQSRYYKFLSVLDLSYVCAESRVAQNSRGWGLGDRFSSPPGRRARLAGDLPQAWAIGYFAKMSSIRLNAFSAAACGVIPPCMMLAHAVPQTCSFWTWA